MEIQCGSNAVMSVPAEMEFAAILVPSCASVKAAEMTKTPKRCALPPSSRKDSRTLRGSQTGSPPKMTVDDEDTMIPMKDVIANPRGMVSSWGRKASDGLRAKRAKSGSFTIKAAKLAIADMVPRTMSQPSSEPDLVPGWCTIGPIPLARTMAQMKKAIPAVGTTYAFTVNKWRILWTAGQRNGREPSQKNRYETKWTVFVPELGIPFGMPPVSSSSRQLFQMDRIMR